jgi:hypothetical protein
MGPRYGEPSDTRVRLNLGREAVVGLPSGKRPAAEDRRHCDHCGPLIGASAESASLRTITTKSSLSPVFATARTGSTRERELMSNGKKDFRSSGSRDGLFMTDRNDDYTMNLFIG